MRNTRALIIDDEPDIRELLSLTLLRMGMDCDAAADVGEAFTYLKDNEYNICLTDMKLPDGTGLDVVRYIQANLPGLPVAVITAHGNMDTAIEAMKAGAFDFLNKPVDLKALRQLVDAAVSSSQLQTSTNDEIDGQIDIIGESSAVLKLKSSIKKLARSQAPVYISGESGTGKELVARAIHKLGPRADQAFVPVNCGAIPSELVESEFFGYKKGAFTGAHQDSEGLFQAASGGTLFLDEVADLPLSMQVKILRAIQEKAVRPVGTQNEVNVDVRILSATHKDLNALVSKGEFRQDLFYRLNVIQLDVPPLRERREDIKPLVKHILSRLDSDLGDEHTSISAEALDKLKQYSFPGNIRELENILERAFTLCDHEKIGTEDLQLQAAILDDEQTGMPRASSTNHFKQALACGSIDAYLEEIEKEILLDALEKDRWNKTNAAKTLGISFRSFRYRLKKLDLDNQNDSEEN
ncbi:sigma-54-dependent transcriptional regulator [Agaribacterium haliotis]|uniref:sigma-54-dependent transcriptional regulator n=1 Tax=Agaribacterium haliotis TaxID=2013869 RepID=UPI000BB56C4C|nr:sigma-54 dependent transcriptional regulator [Agaribacterium haliotis]